MSELFLQAGTAGLIVAVSLKSLDLATYLVKAKFRNGSGSSALDSPELQELQKLNMQMETFLKEQDRHLEISEKIEEKIDRVNRDVLLLKRNGRE